MLSNDLIQLLQSLTTLEKIEAIRLLANELEAEEAKQELKVKFEQATKSVFEEYHEAFKLLAEFEREDVLRNNQ